MDEFNSDDHYIYYCGQESLKRNAVALIFNKSSNTVLRCSLKNNRMGKNRGLFKKIRDTKGIFHAKMGLIKVRKRYGPKRRRR